MLLFLLCCCFTTDGDGDGEGEGEGCIEGREVAGAGNGVDGGRVADTNTASDGCVASGGSGDFTGEAVGCAVVGCT